MGTNNGRALNGQPRAVPKSRQRHRGPIQTPTPAASASKPVVASERPLRATAWPSAPNAGVDRVDVAIRSGSWYPITLSELAGLLAAVTVAGRIPRPVPETLDGLIYSLHADLFCADPQLTEQALSAAASDGAPVDAVIAVAELLHEMNVHPDSHRRHP